MGFTHLDDIDNAEVVPSICNQGLHEHFLFSVYDYISQKLHLDEFLIEDFT